MTGRRRSDPGPIRPALWTLAVLLTLGIWMQAHQMRGLESRLGRMGSTVSRAELHQRSLRSAFGDLRQGLGIVDEGLRDLKGVLEAVREEAAYARALAERLDETEGQLGAIGETVEAQAGSLRDLAEAQASFAPSDVAAELAERDARLAARVESLNAQVVRAEAAVAESRSRVEALGEEIETPRDLHRMWCDLVGPVVQLAGDASVGSGVLLRSRFDPARDTYVTYVLTAWHVVRDIQGDASHRDRFVPTTIYSEDGEKREELARLVCFDPTIDIALLELTTADELQHGARLPRRSELEAVRVFDEIYAVGCPLGNDPIPTRGEISTNHHLVDDELYWMINAPTYIGNSGGGVFHTETHELLGIFSKIYTHGTVRPTIVPHMGLAIPLATIYDWLASEGYDVIEPDAETEAAYLTAVTR